MPTEKQLDNIARVMNRLKSIDDTQFDMTLWTDSLDMNEYGEFRVITCDTAGCLAGWAVMELDEWGFNKGWSTTGMELLGIPRNMFYWEEWPHKLREPLYDLIPKEDRESWERWDYEFEDEAEFFLNNLLGEKQAQFRALTRKQIIEYLQSVLDGTNEEKYPFD